VNSEDVYTIGVRGGGAKAPRSHRRLAAPRRFRYALLASSSCDRWTRVVNRMVSRDVVSGDVVSRDVKETMFGPQSDGRAIVMGYSMNAADDYERFDGLGLAELINSRQVSALELLNAAIQRVEQRNPTINAVVNRLFDEAKADIDRGLPSGLFTGVPYLLKDLGVSYAGTVTSAGSGLLRNAVADHDSEMVARLKRAGLVIFGMTNTSEFGLSTSVEPKLFGPTRNPWNPAYSAGGSSGGAAAAVASGMVPMAHASDGGGSIRVPASCCGLFGLKPNRARNPMGPDFGEGWSGASVGHALTRSVRDSAALLDATSGPDVGDPYWAPPPQRPYLREVGADPGRLKIAFTTDAWNGQPVDPECVAAVTEAASLCESLGHHLEPDSPDIDAEEHAKATRIIITAHTRRALEAAAATLGREPRADDVEAITWSMAESGRAATASDYAHALVSIHRIGRIVGRFFSRFDILLTPTLCGPPYKLGILAMDGRDPKAFMQAILRTIAFTSLFNSCGNPAMSVPLHWSASGLPIGVQFAAPFGDEAVLLRLAAQLEGARPWGERRPRP
jgi:amidase